MTIRDKIEIRTLTYEELLQFAIVKSSLSYLDNVGDKAVPEEEVLILKKLHDYIKDNSQHTEYMSSLNDWVEINRALVASLPREGDNHLLN